MNGHGGVQAWHIGFHNTQWRDQFLEQGFASLGHPNVDIDFSEFNSFPAVKERFDADQDPAIPSSFATQVWKFASEAATGDIIILKDGMRSEQGSGWMGQGRVLALGVITGEYEYAPGSDVYEDISIADAAEENQHFRTVKWVINLLDTAERPFQPQVPIQRWGFDTIDYVALRSQLLTNRDLEAEVNELESVSDTAGIGSEETLPNVWIEKSEHDRWDRSVDEWGLGEALWCPQTMTDRSSSVHYNQLTTIEEGDLILHLDQSERVFTGISKVADSYEETTCLEGTEWDEDGIEMGYGEGERPAYRLPVEDYREFSNALPVNSIFNEEYDEVLNGLRESHTVVWDTNYNLNQEAYLTEAPLEFVQLFVEVFEEEMPQEPSYLGAVEGKSLTQTSIQMPSPEKVIKTLLEDEARPDAYRPLYQNSLAHLTAGKNLVYFGPPGTGKTRASQRLSAQVCSGVKLVTANSEWTNYQVSGGYAPASNGGWESSPGFMADAVQQCQNSLQSVPSRPSWLIIDELNRANLDQAFGEVFTLLDLDYRGEQPIEFGDESVAMPLSFRILATMNTYDKAQLFSLGYAFRRRFAFVNVPSLLHDQDDSTAETPSARVSNSITLSEPAEQTKPVIETAAVESLSEISGQFSEADSPTLFSSVGESASLETSLRLLQSTSELTIGEYDFIDVLLYFAQTATEQDVVEVGQALLIDAAKFVLVYDQLFGADWETVDEAIVSYLLPQFEHFMPELRRAETIDQSNDALDRLSELIGLAKELNLTSTRSVLEEAKESKRLLE